MQWELEKRDGHHHTYHRAKPDCFSAGPRAPCALARVVECQRLDALVRDARAVVPPRCLESARRFARTTFGLRPRPGHSWHQSRDSISMTCPRENKDEGPMLDDTRTMQEMSREA